MVLLLRETALHTLPREIEEHPLLTQLMRLSQQLITAGFASSQIKHHFAALRFETWQEE